MKILCYGDSNTYGYDGDEIFGGRFPAESRWPELLGRLLGCECANVGLNGRRVPRYPRQVEADLALLRRGGERALILVMLGTNDLLCGADPADTAACMRAFLARLAQTLPESAVLLCAPPPVAGAEWAEGFAELAEAYEAAARELGVLFVDTSRWPIPTGSDGVHFSAQGHRLFAMRMNQTIRALLG